MHKFLLTFALCVFCLGLYDISHAGLFGGPEQEQGQGQIQGQGQQQGQIAVGGKGGKGGTGIGVGISGGNEISPTQELGLTQDIDLTENSLVNVSPAMSANGVECDMESGSYSVLLWSYGKSKCSKASAAWRDVEHMMKVFAAFPTNIDTARQIVIARLCAVKELRKAFETAGTDCRLAKMKPKKRARVLKRRANSSVYNGPAQRDLH